MDIRVRDNNLRTGVTLWVDTPHDDYPRERDSFLHFDSIETLEAAIQAYKDSKAEKTKQALREKHTKFKVGDIVRLTGRAWASHPNDGAIQVVDRIDVLGNPRLSNNDMIYWSDEVDWSATKIGEVTENE